MVLQLQKYYYIKKLNIRNLNAVYCILYFFDKYNLGKGQVLSYVKDSANTANSIVYLQHVSGTYFPSGTVQISNNVSYIYGHDSNVNTYFTNVISTANNISNEETVYWEPVTYLEYETDKNEFNKTIRVLDSDLKQIVSDNLRDLLK